eukprot:Plantae.Rhodophyta-Palmaria_palmata.ctg1631.p1 GENE.Plantae.Rhodophyta-Palmaria_palmata.ctg1631~~Plantae.Rhodophyta-Palmaria_palmata.ctg1631.p1  ORF type:complete len:159 (+),score=4.26 Plantae.Rhodophyta-Palmaria_palmata.ctg1631:49-525(+)
MSHIPPIFTIHLKLFAYAATRPLGAKVPVAMACPFSLRLRQWATDDCPQRNDTFRLTSVIVHDGSTSSSGHYYAYVKTREGWYLFDDSDVTPSSEDALRSVLFSGLESRTTSYLLFYEVDGRFGRTVPSGMTADDLNHSYAQNVYAHRAPKLLASGLQ